MKIAIELAGKTRTVERTHTPEGILWAIDGVPWPADAAEIAPGIYSILVAGQSWEVRIEAQGERLRIEVGRQEYSVAGWDRRQWRGGRARALELEGRQQIRAPMPGKVIRVLAKPGESVEAGQGLVVVEAMKMQNEVKSPKSGTVETLAVSEGQSVNAGEMLAVVV